AFLYSDAIPEEIFIVGARELGPTLRPLAHDLIALDEIMETLRAYSLIQRDANENTLTIHRLVQTVLKDGMSKSQQRQWATRAVRSTNRVFPSAEYITDHLAVQRYILQAKTCATLIEEWQLKSKAAFRLLNEAGTFLDTHAQFDDAESLLQLALSIKQQVLAPDHPD